jgi:hypothetical protein
LLLAAGAVDAYTIFSIASVVIQAVVRGWLVRRRLRAERGEGGGSASPSKKADSKNGNTSFVFCSTFSRLATPPRPCHHRTRHPLTARPLGVACLSFQQPLQPPNDHLHRLGYFFPKYSHRPSHTKTHVNPCPRILISLFSRTLSFFLVPVAPSHHRPRRPVSTDKKSKKSKSSRESKKTKKEKRGSKASLKAIEEEEAARARAEEEARLKAEEQARVAKAEDEAKRKEKAEAEKARAQASD